MQKVRWGILSTARIAIKQIIGDAFSQAVLNNTAVPTPIEDAVANMKVIEAVFQSSKTATWA